MGSDVLICKKCQKAAKKNRKDYDNGAKNLGAYMHPKNCGCPCLHKHGPWEKLFSVERPNG